MILEEIQIEGFPVAEIGDVEAGQAECAHWSEWRREVEPAPQSGFAADGRGGRVRDAILRMGGMAPLVWDGEARQINFSLGSW